MTTSKVTVKIATTISNLTQLSTSTRRFRLSFFFLEDPGLGYSNLQKMSPLLNNLVFLFKFVSINMRIFFLVLII